MVHGNDSLLSAKIRAKGHVTELLTKPAKNYIYKSEAEFELLIEYIKLLCSNGRLNQLKM